MEPLAQIRSKESALSFNKSAMRGIASGRSPTTGELQSFEDGVRARLGLCQDEAKNAKDRALRAKLLRECAILQRAAESARKERERK